MGENQDKCIECDLIGRAACPEHGTTSAPSGSGGVKVATLSGRDLDDWVAKAEGWVILQQYAPESGGMWFLPYEAPNARGATGETQYTRKSWRPSEQWLQAGPIIEREIIQLVPVRPGGKTWHAVITHGITEQENGMPNLSGIRSYRGQGPTPLVAAMRAYVASKFGDQVSGVPA